MFPLFDAHCDTASAVFGWDDLRNNIVHTDLIRGGKYSPRGQVYAMWLDGEAPQSTFWALVDHFLWETERNADILQLCRSYEDIKKSFAEGKQAAVVSVEGAQLFGCSIEGLERAYEKGVRIVHLCWNSDNALCGAAMDSGSGLTGQGRDFVKRCGELGVVIDLSHASDAASRDVINLGCAKLMAGHSNSRAICDVKRNLPDSLMAAIAGSGGVIGLNLYPQFLGGSDIALVRRHAEHMLAVCGEKNVCLGCDFDGVDELPDGINGIEDMPKLRKALGFSEEVLDNIFFNNLMNFWERAL